jgi:hypothetical protein
MTVSNTPGEFGLLKQGLVKARIGFCIQMVLRRIAGGDIGSLVGGMSGDLGSWAMAVKVANGNEDAGLMPFILLCPPSSLVGATIGAAAGTTITQQ